MIPATTSPTRSKLATVEALRGIAALAVAWFHFTNGTETYLKPGLLKWSGAYGWLGVEMFFVISGFIIPFAFYRGGYQVQSFGTFVLKRIIRLHPPYLVAIVAIIILNYLSALTPGFQGQPQVLTWGRILTHLAYLNGLLGYPTFNPAFWTLAIEFQWYLLIGLAYPLFVATRPLNRFASSVGLAVAACFLTNEKFVFHYAFLFLVGVSAFQFACGLISRRVYICSVVLWGIGVGFTMGWPAALVAVLTAAAISLVRLSWKWLGVLGAISYSLYLLHVPVGGRVVNLMSRLPDTMPIKYLSVCLALAVSLAAAWLLWRFVEKPAQELSSRFRYRKTPRNEIAAAKSEAALREGEQKTVLSNVGSAGQTPLSEANVLNRETPTL